MPDVAMSGVIALPAGTTIVEVVSGALLVAVIMTGVLFGRRFVVALARAREAERYRSTVADLGTRIDATLGTLVVRVDAVRRRQLEAAAIESDLTTVVERLLGFTAEAEAIREPSRETGVRPGFAASVRGELERAERAIRMIEYGCEALAGGRGRSFARSPDGETALKRGYLNLLHAREALAEDAAAWSGRHAVRKTPPPPAEPDHDEQDHGEREHAAAPAHGTEPLPGAGVASPLEATPAVEPTAALEPTVAAEPTVALEPTVAVEPAPASEPAPVDTDIGVDGAAEPRVPGPANSAGRRRATRRRQRTEPPVEPGDAGPG